MDSNWSVYESTRAWAKGKGLELLEKPQCPSTSELAKSEALQLKIPEKIYLTSFQTEGRGRGENTWISPEPGHGLLATFSFDCPYIPQPQLTVQIGLALFRSFKETWPNLSWSIKAPNDLLLQGKKLGGLLVETVQGEKTRVLIGVGLNILSSPEEGRATSLVGSDGLEKRELEPDWLLFLDQLEIRWKKLFALEHSTELSEENCTELLQALNANPNRDENYLEISPQGDLIQESKTTPWNQL